MTWCNLVPSMRFLVAAMITGGNEHSPFVPLSLLPNLRDELRSWAEVSGEWSGREVRFLSFPTTQLCLAQVPDCASGKC